MANPRVLVVEDEVFTRSLVVNSLQSEDFDVVLETGSATYALKTALRMKIDAAILDLDLGSGPTGLDLALGLRRNIPTIGIVFLTSYRDPRLLGSSSTMAPFGSIYLEKSTIRDLSRVTKGISKSIELGNQAKNRQNISIKGLGHSTDLTEIQIQILKSVAEGMSNHEIAISRKVTEKSIEQTLSRILKKLEIDSNEKKNRRVEMARHYLNLTGTLSDETV
jgi:DNA-binding NarL/FixJ family response regulator